MVTNTNLHGLFSVVMVTAQSPATSCSSFWTQNMNFRKAHCWALTAEQTAPSRGGGPSIWDSGKGSRMSIFWRARNKHLTEHHHVSMCISLNETQRRWVTNSKAVLYS